MTNKMIDALPDAIKQRIKAKYERNILIASLKEQFTEAKNDASEYEQNGFNWAASHAKMRMADLANKLIDLGAIK